MWLDVASFGPIWTPASKVGSGPNRRSVSASGAAGFETAQREHSGIIGMTNPVTQLNTSTIAPGLARR